MMRPRTNREFIDLYRRAKYFYFTSITMAVLSGLAVGFIGGIMWILSRL